MRIAILTAGLIALAACSGGSGEETIPPEEEGTVSDTQDIVTPTDFASLELGGTVRGPLGPEIEVSLIAGDVAVGDLSSRVQCQNDGETCDPETAPEGTIYTYIYEVRPGFDGPNDEGMPTPERLIPVEQATSFALDFPAYGFTGVAGYDIEAAGEMLAPGFNAVISCEGGRITWTVPPEANWSTGETITFFWQSTQPPAGPEGRYRFVADGEEATGIGPIPAEGGEMAAVCE